MEVLNMKVEPFFDEEQDALLNTKLVKNEEETFTLSTSTGEADFLEERSLHTFLKFGVTKEEQEENYDGETEEAENKLVSVKTEQHGDLPQDEIISKFSDNDDNDLDGSKYRVTNVKKEKEFQSLEQTGSEGSTSEIPNMDGNNETLQETKRQLARERKRQCMAGQSQERLAKIRINESQMETTEIAEETKEERRCRQNRERQQRFRARQSAKNVAKIRILDNEHILRRIKNETWEQTEKKMMFRYRKTC
ncbi:uncharacterized protein LOC106467326 [Limulus polyphemus]|uniref:Uncharacterized protein LOC106467326 n=1 Tax=Limulus polyphemus TaxID=6850 RepID=A0ABM1BJB3_LIMPO|nr:uncharacterized protein LOC106467326 [Limulus polyphemus]